MAEAEHKALAALQSPPQSAVYSSLAQKESDLTGRLVPTWGPVWI
jgi:hypothetical protein